MNKLIFVTGGARSGKSSFAEELCINQNNATAYIATSIPFDEEMKDRVRKHRESRPSNWTTYEIYEDVYKIINEISKTHKTIILDCVTLLVTNLMFGSKEINSRFENICDIDEYYEKAKRNEINEIEEYIKDQVKKLINEIKKTDLYVVIVTNEIGMSVVSSNKISRIYTDIVGRINQQIAKESDEVYFVVSGIPMKIKG